jgi:Fe-S cluster assembly iron-binding protein IscA
MSVAAANGVPLTITSRAAEKLKAEADFSRAILSIRHLLGCGGTGFRVSIEQNRPDEGHVFETAGIPVVMDDFAFRRLEGAILDVDPDPAGEGFHLDHPDAVLTTFC